MKRPFFQWLLEGKYCLLFLKKKQDFPAQIEKLKLALFLGMSGVGNKVFVWLIVVFPEHMNKLQLALFLGMCGVAKKVFVVLIAVFPLQMKWVFL